MRRSLSAMVKNNSVIVILLCVSLRLFSQHNRPGQGPFNLPYFEESRLHFGFSLGVNTSNYTIKDDLTLIDSLNSVLAVPLQGFNIGFVGSYRFNDLITIRFVPTLYFSGRNIVYGFQDGAGKNTSVIQPVESIYVMFPVLFKLRSKRYNNFAAYLIGGGSLGYDLSNQTRINNDVVIEEQMLKTQQQTWYAVMGVGTDFFLKYFKFSIEFKYDYGLSNSLVKDGSYWATPIEEIKSRIFSVSLLFEG